MIRRPPRSTRVRSSAASDVYKRQVCGGGSAGHTRTSRPCPHVVYRHPKRLAGPRSRYLGHQNSLFQARTCIPHGATIPHEIPDPISQMTMSRIQTTMRMSFGTWHVGCAVHQTISHAKIQSFSHCCNQHSCEDHFHIVAKIWTTQLRRYCWNQAH